jgi:hypothetical protein
VWTQRIIVVVDFGNADIYVRPNSEWEKRVRFSAARGLNAIVDVNVATIEMDINVAQSK